MNSPFQLVKKVASVLLTCSALVYLLGADGQQAYATTVYTSVGAFDKTDTRLFYELDLLTRALEITREEYGEYILQSALGMTHARAIQTMAAQSYPNFIRVFGYANHFTEKNNSDYLRFPVFRGLIGYRTCFYSSFIKKDIAAIQSAQDLLRFSFGVGNGWADEAILKHNGFKLVVSNEYNSLFKMTAVNRLDLFCRGTNEVRQEYEVYKALEALEYDRTFAVHYPLPHFFYFNKKDALAMERIRKGLLMMVANGEFYRLWERYFVENLRFVRLHKRKIYHFANPFVDKIDFNYQAYDFNTQPLDSR